MVDDLLFIIILAFLISLSSILIFISCSLCGCSLVQRVMPNALDFLQMDSFLYLVLLMVLSR